MSAYAEGRGGGGGKEKERTGGAPGARARARDTSILTALLILHRETDAALRNDRAKEISTIPHARNPLLSSPFVSYVPRNINPLSSKVRAVGAT